MTSTSPLVLIIEDEADIAEVIRSALCYVGFKAVIAATAAQGLETIRRTPPDLVLLDLMLPDVNGYSFLDLLGETGMSNVPVVIVSGCVSAEAQALGLKYGACDYITKPFRIDDLVTRAQRALSAPPPKTPRGSRSGRKSPSASKRAS